MRQHIRNIYCDHNDLPEEVLGWGVGGFVVGEGESGDASAAVAFGDRWR